LRLALAGVAASNDTLEPVASCRGEVQSMQFCLLLVAVQEKLPEVTVPFPHTRSNDSPLNG
jgi:hypothetical protein